ncbi:MAG: peptide chain release factor-like protein [Desulfobacterales bacterium]|nr:peptide chain release factor-like protein [Desulfobacterales bacterium]
MGPDKKKIAALENKMNRLGIKKGDIKEKFIKASGRGGQKVNKTSSAVFLTHIPTGINIKVGKHRSQHLNRFVALRSLVEKIETDQFGLPDKAAQKIARLKKQKKRRKKKAKKKAENLDQENLG